MKKIIIIIIAVLSFASLRTWAQWDPFDFFPSKGGSGTGSYIPYSAIDFSTIPVVPYDNLYMAMTPPQKLSMPYNIYLIVDTNVTYWDLRFDMFTTNIASNPSVCGMNHPSTGTNWWVRVINDSVRYYSGDTVYFVYKLNGSGAWHTYNILFQDGQLKGFVDGVTQFTRTRTTLPHIDTTSMYACVMTWGLYASLGGAYSGNFKGGIDNIYFRTIKGGVDSVVFNTRFNDGGSNQPVDSANWFLLDRNIGTHGWVGAGGWFGNIAEAFTHWSPTYGWRSGSRKDTSKVYPINDSAGLRGYRNWTAVGYGRGVGNRVVTKPTDSTIVSQTGVYTCSPDSNTFISNYVSLIVGTDIQSLGTGGNIANEFGSDCDWNGDMLYWVHSGDSAGGKYAKYVTRCNTLTGEWDSLPQLWRAPIAQLVFFNDTFWISTGTALYARDTTVGNAWILKDTFTVSSCIALLYRPDTLFMFVDTIGIYKRVGGTHVLVSESKGSILYNTDYYDAVTGELWFSGEFDTVGGVYSQNIASYKDGAILHKSKGTYGNEGGRFSEIPGKGKYINTPRGITRWQNQIIAVGQFLYIDSVAVGRGIAQCNPTTGVWLPLDYGFDWLPQGVCTYDVVYKGVTYTNLLVTGDGTAAGGIPVNYISGRYCEEHFAVLDPVIESSSDSTILTTGFPWTDNLVIYSPARRSLTVTATYQKNYDGAVNSKTYSKTDSSLPNVKGFWTFVYSSTYSDTVVNADTLFMSVTVTDNLGNSHDTAYYKHIQGVTIPTDSLKFVLDAENKYFLGTSVLSGGTITNLYTHGTSYITTMNDVSGTITDSTGFGSGFYFNGTNSSLRSPNPSFVLNKDWSVVIRAKWYEMDIYWSLSLAADPYKSYLRYSNAAAHFYNAVTYAGVTQFNYNGVGGSDVDSTVIFTSNGKMYVNGNLRVDNSYTTVNSYTGNIVIGSVYGGFWSKMLLYQCLIYNKILSPAEVLEF